MNWSKEVTNQTRTHTHISYENCSYRLQMIESTSKINQIVCGTEHHCSCFDLSWWHTDFGDQKTFTVKCKVNIHVMWPGRALLMLRLLLLLNQREWSENKRKTATIARQTLIWKVALHMCSLFKLTIMFKWQYKFIINFYLARCWLVCIALRALLFLSCRWFVVVVFSSIAFCWFLSTLPTIVVLLFKGFFGFYALMTTVKRTEHHVFICMCWLVKLIFMSVVLTKSSSNPNT